MFKDKKEELSRLEAELLLEAEAEEEDARLEEELEEDEALLDDENDYGQETNETYFNYSNRYGQIKAYNNDTADGDLDAYSNAVYEGKKKGVGCITLLTMLLLVAVVLALGWYVLRFKGII